MSEATQYTIERVISDRRRRLAHIILAEGGLWRSLPLGFAQRERLQGKSFTNSQLNDLADRAGEWDQQRKAKRAAKRSAWEEQKPVTGQVSDVRLYRGRAYVHMGGAPRASFSLDPELAKRENVVVGASIDVERLQNLESSDQLALAQAKIDDLASRRPRSEAEIRARLRKAGWNDQIVEQAITQSRQYGALNDQAFVDWFINARGIGDGKGWYQVSSELSFRFGIDRELIDAAAAKFATEESLATAVRRSRAGLDLTESRDQKRFIDRLARRGFNYAQARQVLDQSEQEE